MARDMVITFLGTSSGGGPSESRNCSSLVADVLGNGSLWSTLCQPVFCRSLKATQHSVVDCAEGTLRQFALQPSHTSYPPLKVSRVTKIFITHMHGWHQSYCVDLKTLLTFGQPTM
jgi:ribonuclease Z